MERFLPKDFDLEEGNDYCSDYQYGSNKTFSHWHSGVEIIYVVKGTVHVMFNNSWHTLEKDSMIFIPPKQLHFCDCSDESAEKIVIGFTQKCVYRDNIVFSYSNNIIEHCIFHNLGSTNILVLMKEFFWHCKRKSIYSEDLMAKSLLLQIYAFFINYWSNIGLNVNKNMQNETACSIYQYIEAHFTEELSPYDVAKHFHISYSNLAKIMQMSNKASFKKTVHQIRIEHAKKLLALTSQSITEIGLECGFSNTSYFIKIFHKITGMSPNKYRALTKYK